MSDRCDMTCDVSGETVRFVESTDECELDVEITTHTFRNPRWHRLLDELCAVESEAA